MKRHSKIENPKSKIAHQNKNVRKYIIYEIEYCRFTG